MKEPAPASVSDGRRIATLGKKALFPRESFVARPGQCLKDALLPNKAGLPHVFLRFIGSPANYRAREVPEITTARVAREDVQDDQLVCREGPFRARAVAGHLTASNDRVASRFSSRAHHGEFHFNA